MQENPKVSIIVPYYNMGEFLQETIDSVVSYPDKKDYELIIVNDGSTEEKSIVLIKRLETEGFNVIHQKNKGLGAARNAGIKAAKGKYILPLDADNKIRHNYIAESIRIFEKNDKIDIVYGNRQEFGIRTQTVTVADFFFPRICWGNYIDACACYRKTVWETVSGYDENMPVMGYEDWDFWLRAALQGFSFYHLKEVAFDYRVRENSMLSNTTKNAEIVLDYISNKKELTVVKSIQESYNEYDKISWIESSPAYKLGKFILNPIHFLKEIIKKTKNARRSR